MGPNNNGAPGQMPQPNGQMPQYMAGQQPMGLGGVPSQQMGFMPDQQPPMGYDPNNNPIMGQMNQMQISGQPMMMPQGGYQQMAPQGQMGYGMAPEGQMMSQQGQMMSQQGQMMPQQGQMMPQQGQMMPHPGQMMPGGQTNIGGGGWVMPQGNMTCQSVLTQYASALSPETVKKLRAIGEANQPPLELQKSLQLATNISNNLPVLNFNEFKHLVNQFCTTIGIEATPDGAFYESMFPMLETKNPGSVDKDAFVLLCVYIWMLECKRRNHPKWEYTKWMEYMLNIYM